MMHHATLSNLIGEAIKAPNASPLGVQHKINHFVDLYGAEAVIEVLVLELLVAQRSRRDRPRSKTEVPELGEVNE